MNTHQISQVAEKTNTTALSQEQRLFKKLINKIDELSTRLHDLQTAIALYAFHYTNNYLPLRKELDRYQIDFIFLLDSQYHNAIFSKFDQQKITYLITHIAADLLPNHETSSELKALFNCYSNVDYDKRHQQTNYEFKTMMREMFGAGMPMNMDVGIDINARTATKLMDTAIQQIIERHELEQKNEEVVVGTPNADRLKECNQKLTEQLAELKREVQQKEFEFQLRYEINSRDKLMPKKLVPDLLEKIGEVQTDIESIKLDLEELTDPNAIKMMLKRFRLPTSPLSAFDILDDAYF